MNSLRFEQLRIRRMPGISDSFELDDLSPGLNIIYGPNASGKTTTLHAIQSLLWPRAARDHASVSARLRLEDGSWLVDLEAGQTRWQRDGVDAAAAVLPAVETRDRYRLSLHELLAADDRGLAQAIALESAGGYDLMAAARALEPRTAASHRSREVAALRDAEARLRDARALQESLFGDERRLRELEETLAGRDRLRARLRLVELAVEHARAREATTLAAARLDGFDPRMSALRGNEAEQARQIATKLADAGRDELSAKNDQQRAEADLAASKLPTTGLPPELLPALRDELESLRDLERRIARADQELHDSETRRDREGASIGNAADPTRLRELDTSGIETLAAFARKAEQLASRRAVLQEQLDNLRPGAGPTRDREVLDKGVLFLRKWLQNPTGGGRSYHRLRILAILAAVGLIFAGFALARVHPSLVIAALVGAVLLVLIVRPATAPDARRVHQAEFGKLTIRGPVDWSVPAVEGRLTELEGDLASARLAEEKALHAREIAKQLAALGPEEQQVESRRAALIHSLGVDPRVSDASLVWLVDRISRWRDADSAAAGAAAALDAARRQLSTGLARATERIGAHAELAFTDVPGLAGVLVEMERRQKQFDGASAQFAGAQARLATAAAAIESLLHERAAIFGAVGLQVDEMPTLEDWCADHARYRDDHDAHRVALAQRDALAGRLAGMDHFNPSLLDAEEAVLATQLHQMKDRAADLDRVHEEAISIRTRVHDAKRAHTVEDALAGVTRCQDALRAARLKDVRSVLAAALVGFVQSETRDQHLPQVFHRARDLFVQITRGRYRLDFEDGDTPAFRAQDNNTKIGHTLGELSSASRIQLLLAVRLAFIETQEQGSRLPLLLDETLGNSDDERARAIMEALIELAAGGRQLFYFTAQPDEVGKWKGLLATRSDVKSSFIDLAAARKLPRRLDFRGLYLIGTPQTEIPVPNGATHDAYGAVLAVPALDPFAPPDSVHLWYLVENPRALYSLLAELGVERWGALRALLEHGAGDLVDAALATRVRARGKALETALASCRIGRGQPVDAPALERSGAVSDRFMAAVTKLSVSCGGDAARMLDALDQGEVKHFQLKSRQNLREYFENNGYLDPRAPLDPDELRACILASVCDEIRGGVLEVGDVDRLLDRVIASLSHHATIL